MHYFLYKNKQSPSIIAGHSIFAHSRPDKIGTPRLLPLYIRNILNGISAKKSAQILYPASINSFHDCLIFIILLNLIYKQQFLGRFEWIQAGYSKKLSCFSLTVKTKRALKHLLRLLTQGLTLI